MMVTRAAALATWRAHLEEAIGVAEASAVVDPFETVDWANLATKDDLRDFATKDDLRDFATKDDLRDFATKDDLNRAVEVMHAWVDLLRAEIAAAEERSNARLSEAMFGMSERFSDTLRKQTWAIVLGMPTVFAALLTIALTLS